MAIYLNYVSVGILSASGDQSGNQYLFVKPAVTEKKFVVAAGGSGPHPLGILQNKPQDGEAGDIAVAGVCFGKASASITYGEFVTSDTAGELVGVSAGSNAMGRALETGAASRITAVYLFGGPAGSALQGEA